MPRRSRLARLLQFTVFVQIAAAAAWFAWHWPVSPARAIAGVLVVLLLGPLVLGIEFPLSASVSRADPSVPHPRAAELLRAWVTESVHLFRTFWWRQPFRWRAVGDQLGQECAGRTGVVFVHGFMCNRGFWNAWMRRVQAGGRACVAVNLEPVFGSIDAYAGSIDAAVARVTQASGRAPVLVCHSMGGLAARAWWRARSPGADAAALVTIGSPHQGTWMGRLSQRTNGRQMRLRSDWLQRLAREEALHPLPPTTCWYSNCDNIVFPAATARLPGAENRFVPGQPHVALAFQPEVMDACLALLERLDAARQGKSFTATCLENG